MKKALYFIYGFICYAVFLVTFLYMIGFVENITKYDFGQSLHQFFPKTLDGGSSALSGLPAILVNLALIALFGIQHSIMARSGFKKWWTNVVPEPVERSTYVLFASLALIVLFLFWQPLLTPLWDLSQSPMGTIFLGLSLLGWVLLLISTYLINHFELFGLRQVYLHAKDKNPTEMIEFRKPGFYKLIRHPIYFSFLVIFWFAPVMTVGHLIFASGMTAYIFIGIYHEERDLINAFGQRYREYRQKVPKIIPFAK